MVFGWFPWFFKVVSWFFMVFGWFPWFFKVVSWFIMVFGWFPWFFWLRAPQNCILAQQSSLGLAGRRLAFAWYDKIIASVMLILQISLFTCSPSLILPFIIDYKENCICKGVMLIGEDRQEVFSTCGHLPSATLELLSFQRSSKKEEHL